MQYSSYEAPWKLSAFYFFYFALVGTIAPYLPVFFDSIGYSPEQVGTLMAITLLTKMVAPNFWAWLADRTGKRLFLVRIGCTFAAIFLFCFMLASEFAAHALLLFLFSCFWNAVLPQWEVLTLFNLGTAKAHYSRIRLWGSIGFIAAVVGLGFFIDLFSVSYISYWLLFFTIAMTWVAFIVSRQPAYNPESSFNSFLKQIWQKDLIIFFVMSFLLQVSFGPFNTFLSLYLKDLGYSPTQIGFIWSIGVIAEVVLFFYIHRILPVIPLKHIYLMCLLVTILRWFGLAEFADSWFILVILQIIHAASFGGVHAVSIEFVHRVFSSGNSSQGQALYAAISFGAGGAVGAYLSGIGAGSLGIEMTFKIAAVLVIIALGLLLFFWRSLSSHWGKSVSH